MDFNAKPNFYFRILFICLFFSQISFGQLQSFSLAVTSTDETCTGNGSLSFQVSGTAVGASITYAIYLLPNSTVPLTTLVGTTFTGLTAGNYRVVATQTLGNLSNAETQDISIFNTVAPLVYQIYGSTLSCGNGVITIQVSQGHPYQYEIIGGPMLVPLQPSNVFSGLVPGEYVIRVFDTCGEAVVQTFTLVGGNPNFAIQGITFPTCSLVDCNTIAIKVAYTATSSNPINYPLVVEYTVIPPFGAPILLSQIVTSGAVGIDIPFFNQAYSCAIKITDHCGNVAERTNNVIDKEYTMELSTNVLLCARNITVGLCNFVAPYTIQFLNSPSGFNPQLFNATHPGPFFEETTVYVSNGSNQIPNGTYEVKVTDACGRIVQKILDLTVPPEPNYTVRATGCLSGQISFPSNNGSPVATVIITAAPAGYNHSLPYDVSALIADGQLVLTNLPTGTYAFTVISICNLTYTYVAEIPAGIPQPLSSNFIRGCNEGYGSVQLSIQPTAIVSIFITAAPTTFQQTLPYNVTFNISEGVFSMNSLPEGFYSFLIKDDCNFERTFTINVPGYHLIQNNISIDANCGSFNVNMDYQANETAFQTFYLQKWNPIANHWEHPITSVSYIDGSDPNSSNSYPLYSNSINLNIASIGKFRILKASAVYPNGSGLAPVCLETIKEFLFSGGPEITTAYRLPCLNSTGNIVIVANGIAPLSYSITTKDNLPFVVNNGAASSFTGLLPGIYNFQVRDVCGNIVNRLFDLNSLPSPSISQSVLCDGQNGSLTVQNFPFLQYQWWKGNNTTAILSTTNTLNFVPFNSSANAGTYHVRIYSTVSNLCTDQMVSYTILPSGIMPNAGIGSSVSICGASTTLDLFSLLSGSFTSNGTWEELTSSGMLVGHNWLPVGIPFGMYQFRYKVDGLCGSTDDEIVIVNYGGTPSAPVATVDAVACGSGTAHLFASTIPNASYEWSGPGGFLSNEQNPIAGPIDGIYTVKVLVYGCASAPSSVTVASKRLPEFSLSSGCNGNQYEIKIVPIENSYDANLATYSCIGPENYTNSSNPIVITGKKAGLYTVTVSTPNGCNATATIDVENTVCSFPAGISPNGDKANENFDLTGFDVLQFKIFSRYGNLVYEQNNYTNQWHGQDFNDHELPDATYYYYIKFKSGTEKTGWVYVTR